MKIIDISVSTLSIVTGVLIGLVITYIVYRFTPMGRNGRILSIERRLHALDEKIWTAEHHLLNQTSLLYEPRANVRNSIMDLKSRKKRLVDRLNKIRGGHASLTI